MADVEKTQRELGAVIKKPALTEKLLSRPPFRFLHDIFTAVTAATGFGEGLFSGPELDPKSMDKAAKLAWLTKALAVVSVATQRDCPAKPVKIVSGLEAERTNTFLQMLAEAATGPAIASEEAVRAVLNGQTGPSASGGKTATASASKPAAEKPKPKPKPKPKAEAEQKQKQPEPAAEAAGGGASSSSAGRRERPGGAGKRPAVEPKPAAEPAGDDVDVDGELLGGGGSNDAAGSGSGAESGAGPATDGQRPQRPPAPKKGDAGAGSGKPDRPPKPAKPGSKRPVAREEYTGGSASSSAGGGGGGSAAERPTTARGAPPKVRAGNVRTIAKADPVGNVEIDAEPRMAGLILDDDDGAMDGMDDDDGIIVVDGDDLGLDDPGIEMGAGISLGGGGGIGGADGGIGMGMGMGIGGGGGAGGDEEDDDGQHGALVKEIMDLKKDAEAKAAAKNAAAAAGGRNQDGDLLHDGQNQRHQDRKAVEAEIEKLREGLQKLTRAVNPIGKSMDFVHEDLESMARELGQWRSINAESTKALEQQRESTESSLNPLLNELAEIEQKISDQNSRIRVVKGKVAANDNTITKLLKLVITGSG